MPYSEDKPLRSSSTRTAVHFVLLSLFLTVPLHVYPELADSAFYRAAKHLHLHDINVFLESFSASSSSSPTPFRKLLERESPPIADIVDLVARHANPEHRPSVNRIQRIVSQHHVDNNHPKDLFHGVLHEWLTDLVQDHTTVAPEDFPEKRAYLPRPYSYNSVPKLSEYVKSHREREIVPQYGQSLSYSREPRGAPPTDHVNVEPVTPTEHASFEVILTDFLIDRAVEEVITSSLGKTIKELAKHDAAYLVQAMRAVFEQHDLARDFQSLLPAFRAAAADDLQQLPTRLMQMPAFSSEALVSQFALFESIVSGSIPSHAFSLWPSGNGVPTTRKRGICDEVHLIALLAREWLHYRTYSDTPWNDIVIGGFSLSSIRTHRAERATQLVFMDILFAESPCRRDADSSAHLYLEESAAFFELVESVFGQFVRMENEMRRAVLSPSNEKPEPMAIADVISLAVDTIELVENYFHDVGTERERRRLWRRMYLSTIEHRYTDALAAALRYIDLTGTGIGANARRLMALGANIVGAQTGDELQAALEAFADPVGSFATKRIPGTGYVTLGAYLGLIVGSERAFDTAKDQWATHAGVALPLGVEVGYGIGGDTGCCAIGVFLAPIDFGVLANYRISGPLTDPDSIEPPEIGWEQLFAPSAYLVFGFPPDFPSTIAAGIQYAPAARPRENARSANTFRLSVMIAVDVTLLRL